MNWKDYIKSIQDSGIVEGSLESILTNLFNIAGGGGVLPASTVKSWLYNRRNCKSSTYFPKGTINNDAVFGFFRSRPSDKLYNLQKTFKKQMIPDSGSPIDVKTKDLDTFCWSLVNQFLDLLKFERIDIPQAKSDTIREERDLAPHNHKCCLYCIHWNGNKSIVGVSVIPTDGNCIVMYQRNKYRLQSRLSSTAACSNYKADQKLLSRMKECGYNIEDFI